MIYAAAWLCECVASVAHTSSRSRAISFALDVSLIGEIRATREKELIPELVYPPLEAEVFRLVTQSDCASFAY